MKNLFVPLSVILVLLFLLSFIVEFKSENIVFNQKLEEGSFEEFDAYSLGERVLSAVSNFSARANNVLHGGKSISPNEISVNLDDPLSVFSYVWSKVPLFAIVYPTERYYYFSIPDLSLAGNIRFVDVEQGKISFAYFNTENSEQFQYREFSQADGFDILMKSARIAAVSYGGKAVHFLLPAQDTQKPASLVLLPEEEFVVRVQDESAMRFYLIFNKTTKSFYYIVSEPATENLTREDEHLLKGESTGFVYFEEKDPARKILVGVDAYNVMANNYYDGPFDQVPPYLPLREKLYSAYPYTQYMNGLDEYGNFLDFEGQRVAISPYTDYYGSGMPEVKKRVEACEKEREDDLGDFYSCLTYESKKDFHKTIPEFFYSDGRKK